VGGWDASGRTDAVRVATGGRPDDAAGAAVVPPCFHMVAAWRSAAAGSCGTAPIRATRAPTNTGPRRTGSAACINHAHPAPPPPAPPSSNLREISAFELPPASGSASVAASVATSSREGGGDSGGGGGDSTSGEEVSDDPADDDGSGAGERPSSTTSDVSASWAAGRLHRDSLDADARIWSSGTPAAEGDSASGRERQDSSGRRPAHGHSLSSTEGDLRPMDPTLTPGNQIRAVLLAKINMGELAGGSRPSHRGGIAVEPVVGGGVGGGGGSDRPGGGLPRAPGSKRPLPAQWLGRTASDDSTRGGAHSVPSPATSGATPAGSMARQHSPATTASVDSTRRHGGTGGHNAVPSWMGDDDGGTGDGY